MMRWLAALLLLFLLAATPALGSSRRQRGQAVFDAAGCLHCHTINGVGGHKGPDLSSIGKTVKKAAIHRQIVHGSTGMPPFGKVLGGKEINDLVAYLRSCRSKPANEYRESAAR